MHYTVTKTTFKFATIPFVAIVTKDVGRRDAFNKVEVYQKDKSGLEMFLGYASDLGSIGASATQALHKKLYRDGYKPHFAV